MAYKQYNRNSYYKNCFMIDGVAMPIPSEWGMKPQILTKDAKRKISDGTLKTTYVTTCYTITWKYKYLSLADYKKLYNAYITSCASAKSINHTIATPDSNKEGKIYAGRMYTQDDFEAPLYRIDTNSFTRYYKDVTFTFVTRGGKDSVSNYWQNRTTFQKDTDTTASMTYKSYGRIVNNKMTASAVVDSTNEPDSKGQEV